MPIRYLGFATLAVSSLVGCDQLQHAAPQQRQEAPTHGSYSMTTTGTDGTFLVDSDAGKVWRYSAKDEAFLEVPVTSKIRRYERGPDGKPQLVDPKDPLGIRH